LRSYDSAKKESSYSNLSEIKGAQVMFWKKKLPIEDQGAINIPGWVGAYVVPELQKLPYTDHWVKYKGVVRKRNAERTFDIRIFDEWEINQKQLKVTGYSFFDKYPELIQFEGWFDETSKKADIKLKTNGNLSAVKPAKKN
jgi:hypothetical protein